MNLHPELTTLDQRGLAVFRSERTGSLDDSYAGLFKSPHLLTLQDRVTFWCCNQGVRRDDHWFAGISPFKCVLWIIAERLEQLGIGDDRYCLLYEHCISQYTLLTEIVP